MLTRWLKTNWLELFVFGVIAFVYVWTAAPDMTWINTDCDGAHYLYSAKWMYPAHKTSAPLFLLLGRAIITIPLGTEFWRFAMLSVTSSVIACAFIYGIVKYYTNRYYGLIGALIFGGSALAISQGTIVESYALVTMFSVGAFYFAVKSRWYMVAIMLGGGLAVHHLIVFPAVVIFFAFRSFRNWRYLLVVASFLLFYLYLPITNRPPYMWQSEDFLAGFFNDNASTATMLIGGLSIWDFPKRLIETGILAVVCLAAGLIPLLKAFKSYRALAWLTVLPFVYYLIDLSPQTYVYALPGVAFGACLAGVGLAKVSKRMVLAVEMVAVLVMGFNMSYFDIGKTLDPNLEARRFYNQLDKIPNGQVLLAEQGWEWAMVFVYNKYEGRNIIPVCAGNLPSRTYREQLIEQGVKMEHWGGNTILETQAIVSNSIIASNENVWTTRGTDIRNYGAEIIKATPIVFEKPVINPTWKWKPDNPYDIITGAAEVGKWHHILLSNYSVLMFMMLGTIGGVPAWILWQIFVKKRKWSLSNVKKEV